MSPRIFKTQKGLIGPNGHAHSTSQYTDYKIISKGLQFQVCSGRLMSRDEIIMIIGWKEEWGFKPCVEVLNKHRERSSRFFHCFPRFFFPNRPENQVFWASDMARSRRRRRRRRRVFWVFSHGSVDRGGGGDVDRSSPILLLHSRQVIKSGRGHRRGGHSSKLIWICSTSLPL